MKAITMSSFHCIVFTRKNRKIDKYQKILKSAERCEIKMQPKKNKDIIRLQKEIIPILKKNNVARAGIFGSYARGEGKKKSDIDIIIQPPRGMGLGFVGMKLELEEKLGKKVDLLTYKSISPYLKKYILNDEVRII